MSSVKSAIILPLLFLLCAAAARTEVFEDAFIVEHGTHVTSLKLLRDVEAVMSGLGSPCTATARFKFDSPHFAGTSFELKCAHGLDRRDVLSAIQRISTNGKVWPVATHYRQVPYELGHALSVERDLETAHKIAPRTTAPYESAGENLSTHRETQVDRLHAENITGAGIRIAVIDSGFDTSVPGLSGTSVAYARDFTTRGSSAADNCSFHGTHVLGILGAKSPDSSFGANGVAYNAVYELYRIEACRGPGARSDVVMQAMIEAAHRDVDIISCSFGGTIAFTEDPLALTASRIMNNGTYVAFPTGNSGPGPFTGLNPGGTVDIAAVGASDNPVSPCYQWEGSMTMGDKTGPLMFVPGDIVDFPKEELTVWSPTRDFTDAQPANCSRIPDDVELPADPAQSAMLVLYYQCWVDSDGVDIFKSAKFGGKIPYAIRYMRPVADKAQSCPMVFQAHTENLKGLIGISWEDGRAIFDELSKGGVVTVSLPSDRVAGREFVRNMINTKTGGLMSVSSSWGPALDARGMPSFVAPGGNILSTFPARLGGWGVIGGTSMATPYTAGAAALVMQTHPQWNPAQVKAAIVLTAKPVRFHDQKRDGGDANIFDFLAPTISQGGGLVDVWAAAHIAALVNVSSLSFNDTAHRPSSLAFILTNAGSEARSYDLHHIGAASGYLLDTTGGAQYNFTKAEAQPVYADVSISPSHIDLNPGASAVVSVSVEAEPALPEAATRVSYFGGYIAINSTRGDESLTLPYNGIGGNLRTLPMINRDETYMGRVDSTMKSTARTEAGHLFTCQYNSTDDPPASFPADGMYPGVQLTLVTQTRNLTIDLVRKDSGAAVIPKDYTSGPSITWNGANWWTGRNGNRTIVFPGEYFWRITTLRLNTDAQLDERNWDVWESAVWELQYTANSTGLPEPTTGP